jgi:hypothetical protein
MAKRPIVFTIKNTVVPSMPAEVTSDADGNFTATILAPSVTAGVYAITASDGVNSSTANFAVSISVKMESQGEVGSVIPVTGCGFAAGAVINIKYDGISMASATTDAKGFFEHLLKYLPGWPVSTRSYNRWI